jgi:hypothetical protein
MHSQGNSFYINEKGDACLVQCYCGLPHHGEVSFHKDTPGWSDGMPGANVGVRIPRVRQWKWRLRDAWDALTGKEVDLDFEISTDSIRELAAWLTKAADQLDEGMLVAHNAYRKNLADLRAVREDLKGIETKYRGKLSDVLLGPNAAYETDKIGPLEVSMDEAQSMADAMEARRLGTRNLKEMASKPMGDPGTIKAIEEAGRPDPPHDTEPVREWDR